MAIRYICEEIADCAKCDDTECKAIDIKTYQQVKWTRQAKSVMKNIFDVACDAVDTLYGYRLERGDV